MAPRLSELLESIRPAGAPGAPTEGELQRRLERRADELGGIISILADLEAEADAVVAAARREADGIIAEGAGRARAIHAGIPERVAVAATQAAQALGDEHRAEVAEVRAWADATTRSLRERADQMTPHLVDQVLRLIWSQVPGDTGSSQ